MGLLIQANQVLGLLSELVDRQWMTADQCDVVRFENQKTGKTIDQCLVELGFLSEKTLTHLQAELSGVETIDLKEHTVLDVDLVRTLPRDMAETHKMILISLTDKKLHVAMVDVHDLLALDVLKRLFGRDVEIQASYVMETDLLEAIDRYYGYEMSITGLLREIETGERVQEDSFVNPTIRLVNALILDAIKAGASDIHFEPEGAFVRVRYRIDGLLVPIRTLHGSYWPAMCVRLKIMSEMNIAESRRPQSGRFSMRVGPREIDFRVAAHPTIHGENIVVRILDKTRSLISLSELGYSEHVEERIKACLQKPEGIFIITGPTGCGKTTSLYSMLNFINTPQVNIMTLEEPVEYQLPLIRQSDVRDTSLMTFAEGVRSILRQDPDIILVGEIRDADTAQMALRASMTGHQVYATLHTNDSFGSVGRLMDLGLSPRVLAGNMIAVVGQRLLRRLCVHCKEEHTMTHDEAKTLHGALNSKHWVAKGCDVCRYTGYHGRFSVAEVLEFDEGFDDLVASGAQRLELKKYAKKKGFVSLEEDTIQRIFKGDTSLEEAHRVVGIIRRSSIL